MKRAARSGDSRQNIGNAFFSDPEAFEALKNIVFPAILKDRTPTSTIRIWVPGCRTGEEAYSFAIAVLEYLAEVRAGFSVQVFGTDSNEADVQTARWGAYSESACNDIEPARLEHYFTAENETYRANKRLRGSCVFATQDLANDPPFSRMDLIAYRNQLSTLRPDLQQRVLSRLHYALKPTGFLILGRKESTAEAKADLFEKVQGKYAIYRKKAVPLADVSWFDADRYAPKVQRANVKTAKWRELPDGPVRIEEEIERHLLARYLPAAIIVDDNLEILHTRGNASCYVELPQGRSSLNLLQLLDPELIPPLRDAVGEARAEKMAVRRENIQIEDGRRGFSRRVNLEVVPLEMLFGKDGSPKLLIVLEHRNVAPREKKAPRREKARVQDEISRLRLELTAAKEFLQTTIDLERIKNEELQAANEETQTSNEELQSANEELMSTNEELRTVNEELQAFKDRLESTHEKLNTANATMRTLAAGHAKLEETFHLMQSGLVVAEAPTGKLQMGNDRLWEILGESVREHTSVLDYASKVLDSNGAALDRKNWAIARSMRGEVVRGEEIEWRRSDGQHLFLSVNATPIRNQAGNVISVVATFVDMTYRRKAEEMLVVSEQMAATGRLSAALAHEINNPLEALTNLYYLVSIDSSISQEVRNYMNLARTELDRISHISRSLLGFYRGESKAESFLVRDVINDVLEVFAVRITAGKVRVVKRYEAEGVMHGSFTEVRQVFLNIIGNALESMQQRGTLTIRTSASRNWRDLSVRGFRVSVSDNGAGIPAEFRPRLFEPFFTTKGTKGTGLGLWVSKGIVHRHGGNIRARTRTGPRKSGTTFSIFLPNSTVNRALSPGQNLAAIRPPRSSRQAPAAGA